MVLHRPIELAALTGNCVNGPRGSLQKRPMGDGSKPTNGAARNLILLSLFLLLRQARFCAPALWAAFQDVTVVEQAVEHSGDGGAVAE
jgi:hypothetical protein